MKSFVAILLACASLPAMSVVSGCGDDADGGGTGGGAGTATVGGASGSGGGKAGAGSSSGGTGGGSSNSDACAEAQAVADARQAELDCPNGTGAVEDICNTVLGAAPDCEDEFAASVACGEALAESEWECDEDGFTSSVEGTCPAEDAALEACLGI